MEISGRRMSKLALRWSILSAAAAALYWGVWYLVTGSVPATTELPLWPGWAVALPFAVSRWWDVAVAPVFIQVVLRICHLADRHVRGSKGFDEAVAYCLFFVLAFGPAAGLVVGLTAGLAAGLSVGFLVGLMCGSFGLIIGNVLRLAGCLAVGFIACLAFGLAFGLTFGFLACLAIGLNLGTVFCFRWLVASRAFARAGRWLVAYESMGTELKEALLADPRRVRIAELREGVRILEMKKLEISGLDEEIEAKRLELAVLEDEQAVEQPQPYRC